MNYRNQWPAFPGAFITTAASFDKYFDNLKGGLGLSVLSDQVGNGVLVTNQVIYLMRITNTFLEPLLLIMPYKAHISRKQRIQVK